MDYRKDPEFPRFNFYQDGRIYDIYKGKYLNKGKDRFKLPNKDNERISISVKGIIRKLFSDVTGKASTSKNPNTLRPIIEVVIEKVIINVKPTN